MANSEHQSTPSRRPFTADDKALMQQMIADGASVESIAAAMGRNVSTLARALNRFGIKRRRKPPAWNVDSLRTMTRMKNEHATNREIAAALGAPINSVKRYWSKTIKVMKSKGMKPPRREAPIHKKSIPDETRAAIREAIRNGDRITNVAARFNVARSTVRVIAAERTP